MVAVEVLLKRWIAHDGDRTLIAEVDARQVPGAQNDYCLIHETEMSMRRLWHYPQDWNQLDDAKLIALFEAPLAGRRRRSPVRRGQHAPVPHPKPTSGGAPGRALGTSRDTGSYPTAPDDKGAGQAIARRLHRCGWWPVAQITVISSIIPCATCGLPSFASGMKQSSA